MNERLWFVKVPNDTQVESILILAWTVEPTFNTLRLPNDVIKGWSAVWIWPVKDVALKDEMPDIAVDPFNIIALLARAVPAVTPVIANILDVNPERL